MLWILLEISTFLEVILQVRHQNVLPALCSSLSQLHPDIAVGRVTQADQEPLANLCCGYGSSEQLRGSEQGTMAEELTASSEWADSYLGDKQKLRVSFQIQTLLRKQLSAN